MEKFLVRKSRPNDQQKKNTGPSFTLEFYVLPFEQLTSLKASRIEGCKMVPGNRVAEVQLKGFGPPRCSMPFGIGRPFLVCSPIGRHLQRGRIPRAVWTAKRSSNICRKFRLQLTIITSSFRDLGSRTLFSMAPRLTKKDPLATFCFLKVRHSSLIRHLSDWVCFHLWRALRCRWENRSRRELVGSSPRPQIDTPQVMCCVSRWLKAYHLIAVSKLFLFTYFSSLKRA